MLKPLNLLKNFASAVLKPTAIPEPEDAPAIDIWVYAEPAGEEPNPLKRNVLQWRRVISSVREPLDVFPGQPVDVIGFVHRTPNDDINQFTVARHIIRCCLADTIPLGLTVQCEKSTFATETWVHVQGKFARVADSAGEKLAIIPTSVKVIPQPQKLYINGVF